MNLTPSQILALDLEDRQKLVVEMRQVNVNDKAYPNAKAVIDLITKHEDEDGDPTYEDPGFVEVKNIAGHDVTVDGATVAKDATAKVYPWQQRALARFLAPVAKAAALVLFAFLLCLGGQARATTTALIGAPGSYQVLGVAGLVGGTNAVPTNTVVLYTGQSITTNTIISPSILVSNGVTYFSTTTNSTYVTNVPGVVAIPNYDQFTLTLGGALFGAAGTSQAKVDYSPDALMWQTNKWQLPFSPIGNEVTCTNLDVTGVNGGFIRLNSISGLVTSGLTNAYFEVTLKPSAHGP